VVVETLGYPLVCSIAIVMGRHRPPAVAGYEWVRDNVLKYGSSITFATSIIALQHQLKLANP